MPWTFYIPNFSWSHDNLSHGSMHTISNVLLLLVTPSHSSWLHCQLGQSLLTGSQLYPQSNPYMLGSGGGLCCVPFLCNECT
jgi:hypothetical protein